MEARLKLVRSGQRTLPTWRLLCGYVNCRGELGELRHAPSPRLGWEITLPGGFVALRYEHAWQCQLGRHAARSGRHEPRRTKRLDAPARAMLSVSRRRDGQLLVNGLDWRDSLERWDSSHRDQDGKKISARQSIPCLGLEGFCTEVVIVCPRCRAPSDVPVKQIVEGGAPVSDPIAS